MDLSKYIPKLITESRKNLSELDQSLVILKNAPSDAMASECAFRAAHSIKGGAAMFGLDRIAALAAELEDAFYKVTSSKQPVSTALLDAAQTSREVLSDLIDSAELKIDLVPGFEKRATDKLAAC